MAGYRLINLQSPRTAQGWLARPKVGLASVALPGTVAGEHCK